MKTMRVPIAGRILLAIAALPCWVMLVLGIVPLFYGEASGLGAETPVFVLIAGTLTAIVLAGRIPVLE